MVAIGGKFGAVIAAAPTFAAAHIVNCNMKGTKMIKRLALGLALCGTLIFTGYTGSGMAAAQSQPDKSAVDLKEISWAWITPEEITPEIATAKGDGGWTALAFAARRNKNPEVFRKIVALGGDVNALYSRRQGHLGYTALLTAAEYSRNPEIIRVLVELGADVNHQSLRRGRKYASALHLAASRNRRPGRIIRTLVELGADINIETRTAGTTPLNWAADFANKEGILTLLDLGADAKHRTRAGRDIFFHSASPDNRLRGRLSKIKGTEAYRRLYEAVYQ